MFAASRTRALNDTVFAQTNDAEYIEAWKYDDIPLKTDKSSSKDDINSSLAVYGRLREKDLESWLLHDTPYAEPPNPPAPGAQPSAHIRLLICERQLYRPPSLSITKESWLEVEKEFGLHEVTLDALVNESGLCARFQVAKLDRTVEKLHIVIKAPQKYQVGNYGLSIVHDFARNLTTGVLIGTGVLQGSNDFPVWRTCPSAEIYAMLQSISPAMLPYHLVLPTLLLQHHIKRTSIFCNTHLSDSYSNILNRLGMTRAGRMHLAGPYEDPVGEKTIEETRVHLRDLTGEMNTHMTEITWYCKVTEWQGEVVDFLKGIFDEDTSFTRVSDAALEKKLYQRRNMKECLEYLKSDVKGLQRHTAGAKESAEANFGVLYSVIAQVDNRLTAKISASASRDSSAMKMLAFITSFFLPGTFIATVFSMDMFAWSPPSGPNLVSSHFWIYWVVTIPLTIMIAACWRLWWRWEKSHFDRDLREQIENIEEVRNGTIRIHQRRSKWEELKEKGQERLHGLLRKRPVYDDYGYMVDGSPVRPRAAERIEPSRLEPPSPVFEPTNRSVSPASPPMPPAHVPLGKLQLRKKGKRSKTMYSDDRVA